MEQAKRSPILVTLYSLAIMASSFIIFLQRETLCKLFNTTLDAFHIAAGTGLFLSTQPMIKECPDISPGSNQDIAIMPFALLFTFGSGVINLLITKKMKNTHKIIMNTAILL